MLSILTLSALQGAPFTVPSAMSKAGLNIMTQSLAVEWGSRNIRFNAIAPGPFPTEGAWARLNPSSAPESSSAPGNPMGRVGRMPELANLAIYLFAPGSEYVNGQTIAIDGAAHQAGGGGFSRLREWTDEQWESARAAIQGANQRDRAKRTV